MTGELFLDWAIMAVSLFNTILLLWLGLTVLLNAERRTLRQAQGKRWGVWLAGGGMLMGGAFFVSHSAILGHGLHYVSQGMDFWWRTGWVPVVTLPVAWYVVMLWYAGFWDDGRAHLYRRQRPWFLLTMLLAVGLMGLLIFANPLPSYWQVVQLKLSATPSLGGIPLLILIYPPYIVLCISLSLDALHRPGPSGRVMGDLARRRARPWLVATSVVLLLISLLVAWIMLWIVLRARQRMLYGLYTDMALIVAWFDLIIASLVAVVIIFLGKAVVSYEVFTGKILPRHGFFRNWRSAVILAAGYGAVVGWSLTLRLRPVYSLLLTTILMVVFYALFSWRSYAERERYIERLRPFAASQRLYDYLLTPSAPTEVDAVAPFRALCDDVLGARVAYLVALGPLAPLVGPALAYPSGDSVPPSLLAEVTAQFDSPQTMCVALDPVRYGGATWAVPLWSERGLIGVLLLGEKRDGGLYTQEEIEIARASGERLIDTQASAEMSRRLMALLRQRIAQVKVMEGQSRRALHDQVLPQLHTAILYLSGLQETPAIRQAIEALTSAHRHVSDLMRDTSSTVPHQLAQQGLVAALRALVERDFESDFDQVVWQVTPDAIQAANQLPPFVSEVIFFAAQELIRNAARHGRGEETQRPLRLRIALDTDEGLRLIVEDDGVGFNPKARSSLATAASGGSGLRFHSTMLAAVGASMEVMALPAGGTRGLIMLLPEG